MKKFRNKIKLANMLQEAFCKLKKAKLRHLKDKFEQFRYKCSEVAKDSHIFYTAVDKGWFGAAEKIKTRVNRNLCDFSYQLQQFKNLSDSEEIKLPKLVVIFADLNQIEDEFGELKFDLEEKTISVITDSIELDDIALGPFEIKLFVDQMSKLYSSNAPYKVIALEPNPAATDGNVTHPHVSSEQVCEGDGHIAIRVAIEQGRLCDLFTMVANILKTYNPDSPYVALSDWEGICCYDCGYTVADDDCYYCENCEHDYCSSCSSYCQICETTICMGCSYECPACNQPVCSTCTAACSECDEILCKDCINEEGLCNNCQEQREEDEDEELKEKTTTPDTIPAVQPDSLGQTRIPA